MRTNGLFPTSTAPQAPRVRSLTQRIGVIVESVALDCDCRQRVTGALERFASQEQDRRDRRYLLEARQHRAAIAALIDLLTELDDIDWRETDRTAFGELAHIFDDIAHQAGLGAAVMREMSESEGS